MTIEKSGQFGNMGRGPSATDPALLALDAAPANRTGADDKPESPGAKVVAASTISIARSGAPWITISAYLADLSKLVVLEIGKHQLDVAAAVLAHQWPADELAVEGANPARWRNAVTTAILLAPVG